MTPKKTLKDWIATIENEVMFVNVKPYSHNIISTSLMAIAKEYGTSETNKVIEQCDLERLGWNKVQ